MFEKILRFLNPLGLPLFGGMGRAFRYAAKENEVFSRLVNFPNEENAREYIELRKNRPVFTLAPANNPNAWAVLREKWQIINHSDQVPTDLKKEIQSILIAQGLYLSNSKIIDNYKNTNK